MKKKIIKFFMVLMLCLWGVSSAMNVYAGSEWFGNDIGGYIGGTNPTPDPGLSNCNNTRTLLSCMGYSWIFFEAVKGAPKVELEFRPRSDYPGVATPVIDATCADWSKEGMGFWHLGRNAVSYADPDKPVFNSWYEEVLHRKAKNQTDDNRFYLNWGNAFGHMTTFNYQILRTKYRWAKYRYRLSDFPNNINNAVKNGILKGVNGSQSLYKRINGVAYKIYESKYTASEDFVFEEFRRAWRRAYGTNYSGSEFPDGLYAFCFAPYTYKITALSIDQSGNSLSSVSGLGDQVVEVRESTTASVTRGINAGYEFLGWRLSPSGGYVITTNANQAHYVSGTSTPKETFNIKSILDDFTVYAVYKERNSFRGQVKANDTVIVGYTDQSESKHYNIDNCNPVSGCKVTFGHNLHRTSPTGATNYTISRTSNYWTGSVGVQPKNPLASGRETFVTANALRVYTDTVILKPGQVVCETLSFNSYSTGDSNVSLTICASALGNAQPPDPADPNDPNHPENDPNGDTASDMFLDIEVKNRSVARYNTYRRIVYAKPMDDLIYRASYNPILQYTYYLKPQKLRINGGTIYPSGSVNVTRLLKDIFNERKPASLGNWNNAFRVISDGPGYYHNFIYNGGDTTKRVPTNNYKVKTTDVGLVLKETAKTNATSAVKTTPSQVSFVNSGNNNVANVITTDRASEAVARVPYNFNTAVEIETNGNEVLEAGSNKTINYKIMIKPKTNQETTSGTTDQAYASIVRNARSKAIVYTTTSNIKPGAEYASDNLCSYFTEASSCQIKDEKSYSELNREWNSGSGSTINSNFVISTDDANAGSRICVAVAIYPSHSGSDINLHASGSKKWRISNSKCFGVAKKPTFQVWGGSLYGAKNISTNNFSKTIDGKKVVFGSWVEHSVVASGIVRGLASGASMGLASNVLGGGSVENPENYCKYRTPLSFANYSKVYSICQMAQATGLSGITVRKIKLDDIMNDTEIVDNNIVISNTHISPDNTYVINTSGNVTINGNIIYQDGTYTSLEQIPKAFISANNIKINCNVTRIDAVLIAKNNIDTCDGSDNTTQAGLNARERSNQLQINGAIITGSLSLNRTYGAAAGIYSKIPAEIINYDTSIILWGNKTTETNEYGKIYQSYLHELAPRY